MQRVLRTVLFLGRAPGDRFLITAKHVIDKFNDCKADDVWIRVNTKAGKCDWVLTKRADWEFPKDPALDAAVRSTDTAIALMRQGKHS